MKVFQNTLVVVSDGNCVFLLDQVDVVVSGVTNVVAGAGKNVAKHIPRIKLALLLQLALCTQVVKCLSQIGCMGLVVISDVEVALLDLLSEIQKFLISYWEHVKQLFLRKDIADNRDKLVILCDFFDFEDIELKLVNLNQLRNCFTVELQDLLYCIKVDGVVGHQSFVSRLVMHHQSHSSAYFLQGAEITNLWTLYQGHSVCVGESFSPLSSLVGRNRHGSPLEVLTDLPIESLHIGELACGDHLDAVSNLVDNALEDAFVVQLDEFENTHDSFVRIHLLGFKFFELRSHLKLYKQHLVDVKLSVNQNGVQQSEVEGLEPQSSHTNLGNCEAKNYKNQGKLKGEMVNPRPFVQSVGVGVNDVVDYVDQQQD